jgi:hypothetical protein
MKPKKLHLHILALLFACTSAAWGQQLFGDLIQGSALVCTESQYNKSGSTKHGYDLTGKAFSSCKLGSARASNTAHVGPPVFSATSSTTYKKGGAPIAAAIGSSYEEVILTPPEGYKGDSVEVKLKSAYEFNVAGVGGTAAGEYDICWIVDDTNEHCMQSTSNGNGTQKVDFNFTVTKADGEFGFRLQVSGSAESGYGASASVKAYDTLLKLPSGWAWDWASDDAGYATRTGSQPR